MNMIWVKPAEGRHVPMPPGLGQARGLPVPSEGQRVELTPFVQRRLDCGDLVEVKEDAPAAKGSPSRPAPDAAQVKES